MLARMRAAYLALLVVPVVREVDYSYRTPVVWDLSSCAVDDSRDLVCHDELKILRVHFRLELPEQRIRRRGKAHP